MNNLSSDGYRQIVNENLGPFMRNFNNGNCYLIQDNAPTHRVNETFFLNQIRWVKLPPYSPDINIIELVWADLKRYLRKKCLKTLVRF